MFVLFRFPKGVLKKSFDEMRPPECVVPIRIIKNTRMSKLIAYFVFDLVTSKQSQEFEPHFGCIARHLRTVGSSKVNEKIPVVLASCCFKIINYCVDGRNEQHNIGLIQNIFLIHFRPNMSKGISF